MTKLNAMLTPLIADPFNCKGKVTMMFITHAMPKNLLVDEIIRIGQGSLSAVAIADTTPEEMPKREAEGGGHG